MTEELKKRIKELEEFKEYTIEFMKHLQNALGVSLISPEGKFQTMIAVPKKGQRVGIVSNLYVASQSMKKEIDDILKILDDRKIVAPTVKEKNIILGK